MHKKELDLLFDMYEVYDRIGSGTYADVFRVRDTHSGAIRALKVLRSGDEQHVKRLHREATIQSAVKHPNLVEVVEVFVRKEELALVMEYIEGDILTDSPIFRQMSLDVALEIFEQLLSGMSLAHRAGVIHRDLEPNNVMVTVQDGKVQLKVIDFGLAKAGDKRRGAGLTRTGSQLGTPGYAAPEQMVDSSRVGPAADIFSLGTILYELICRTAAYHQRRDFFASLMNAAEGRYVPVRHHAPDCPVEIAEAVEVAIRPRPEDRYDTCEQFAMALYGRRLKAAPPAIATHRFGAAFAA